MIDIRRRRTLYAAAIMERLSGGNLTEAQQREVLDEIRQFLIDMVDWCEQTDIAEPQILAALRALEGDQNPKPTPMPETWIVAYRCPGCGRRIEMPSAKPSDMVLVGRAWCLYCDRYITKRDAIAESRLGG